MTPNRTAPPVARRLAERPAAPPLPPAVLVGDEVAEERLLLREESRLLAEDTREERLLETPERIEERLEEGNGLTEEAGKKTVSTHVGNSGKGTRRTATAKGSLDILGSLNLVRGTVRHKTCSNR